MKITPKEPSEIEAQTAAFLNSDHVPGSLSYKGMAQAARSLVKLSHDQDIQTVVAASSPYANETHIKGAKSAYVSFLREQSTLERDEMKQLAPYIKQFETFRESINQETFYHSNQMGEGEYSKVYKLRSNGRDYALRVPDKSSHNVPMSEVHKHLRACLRVADLDHVERLVAVSYTEGITVSEIASGVEVSKLSLEEFEEISRSQIKDFHDTITTAYKRGVSFDAIGRNLFYDSVVGFTAIDLGVIDSDYQRDFYKDIDKSVNRALHKGLNGAIRQSRINDITEIGRLEDALNRKVREALSDDIMENNYGFK